MTSHSCHGRSVATKAMTVRVMGGGSGFEVPPSHVVMMRSTTITLLLTVVGLGSAWNTPACNLGETPAVHQLDAASPCTRRFAIATSIATLMITTTANAFPNKISDKYDDRPKRRGPKPPDLGIGRRPTLDGEEYVGLKSCGASPNCFSSTITRKDDVDHSIPAWIWPKGYDMDTAMNEVVQVIKAYPPGQSGVDGGGFEIQKVDKGYVYVQFEALKNGYIDDVEFAVIDGYPERSVQVRSSSRVGYLDFGVNAKRLNWIATALRSKGWTAEGVDFREHKFYASENQILIT